MWSSVPSDSMDAKQLARAFLVYQGEQPGGLPSSKADLRECYSLFCSLQPPGTLILSFETLLGVLHRTRLVRSKYSSDAIYYNHKVVVDHTVSSRRTENAPAPGAFYCELCKCSCSDNTNLQNHLSGQRHIAKLRVKSINNSKEDNEKDKYCISITPQPIDFGPLKLGFKATKVLTITNSWNQPQMLVACELVKKSTGLKVSDLGQVCNGGRTYLIPAKGSYQVVLDCNAYNLGYIRDVLIFRFSIGTLRYNIFRYINIHVADEDAKILAPTSPYVPPPKKHTETPSEIIPGIPVPRKSSLSDFKPLPQFRIPPALYGMLNRGEAPHIGTETDNYEKFFSHLLWFEEAQMDVDIRRYDTWSTMNSHGNFIILKVPGLAENRPSVLVGDSVYVSSNGREYEGVVHRVEMEHVHLCFHYSFHRNFNKETRYKIRFSYKRTPLRVMHQAIVDTNILNKQILFPSNRAGDEVTNNAVVNKILSVASILKPINRRLNTQQIRAVAAIMISSARPCPYVIFGPPGTGKTVTVVEAIGQVYSTFPSSRILACAPSNTAADLITERLLNSVIQKRDIFRFNAYNRRQDLVPPEVLAVSSFDSETYTFATPTKADLNKKRVIVATCVNAAKLSALGVTPFDYLFVDEAGQAMEPECISTFCINSFSTVVLAGDPQQLGPVIRSPFAMMTDGKGLGRSMLERILQRSPYARDPVAYGGFGNYDLRLITKLVNNYRSHPEILSLPNELFYHNELQAMADVMLRSSLCNWDGLPTKGFPVLFHGIEGKDEREGSSPSWFNVDESMQIYRYITLLQAFKATKVNLTDIGVITPYRKQAEKIRVLLNAKNMKSVKVGSVEEFQGQERLVIIISCVRSNSEHVAFDLEHNLGFLKNPKRFNVATTRAKALLIVIGNPHVLTHDPFWARLIYHCIDNHSYVGCTLPSRSVDAAVDDLSDVFGRLHVGKDEGDGTDFSLVEGREGPEWRTY